MVSWGHRKVVFNMILPVIFIIKSKVSHTIYFRLVDETLQGSRKRSDRSLRIPLSSLLNGYTFNFLNVQNIIKMSY